MTFPFAARTNAPNTRAASMEPLEVLLPKSTNCSAVDSPARDLLSCSQPVNGAAKSLC